MNKELTSIIIVNYNTRELTCDCICSIQQHCIPGSYEIIVVDNHSSDESVDFLKSSFSSITVIANEKNVGFGSANNIGAAAARGKYLFLLNSDTILREELLSKFIRFYKDHQHLKPGVIGTLLLSNEGTVVHSFGNYSYFLRSGHTAKKAEDEVLNQVAQQYYAPVQIVVGADMFVEKAVFDSFAGFDPHIFLYEEELELQYRMQLKGYSSIVINEKSIVHLEGQSSGNYFKRKCSLLSLNYILKKHHPYWLYLFCRMRMIFYAVAFFKNPKTSWKEKINYLQLSVLMK